MLKEKGKSHVIRLVTVEPEMSYTVNCVMWLLWPTWRAEYCDQFVCLSVCVSVCEHISGTAGPIFTNFICRSPVAVARSSDSVAIHPCASGLMDDVMCL